MFCTKWLSRVAAAGLATATAVGLIVGTPTTEEGRNHSIAVANSHVSPAAGQFSSSSPYLPDQSMYGSSGGCHGRSTQLNGSFLTGASCYGGVASPGMPAAPSSGGCFGRNDGPSDGVAIHGGGCYGRPGGG
jgi:hypothetical protein